MISFFTVILGIAGIIYVVVILLDINLQCTDEFEHHEGGFLNIGYTTSNRREPTGRDVRRGFIWPLRVLASLGRTIVGILNDSISVLLLGFGVQYRNSPLFRRIDRWGYDI